MRRIRCAVVATISLLLALASVPAGATHDPIQTLKGEAFGAASHVAVGLNTEGQATAVWIEGGAAYVATRPPGGFFGSPSALITNYASEVAFDEADNGNAVIGVGGGMDKGRLAVSVRNGDGDFSAPQYLIDPSGEFPFGLDVAISEAGQAVAVWESANTLFASVSDAAGTFGPVVTVDSAASAISPSVDMDDKGNALVAYDWHPGQAVDEVRTASAPVGSGFGAPQTVEVLAQGPGHPRVAVSSGGAAVVVWSDFTDDGNSCGSNCSSRDVLEAVYGTVFGRFGAIQEITNPDSPTAVGDHAAAVDDSGRAAILFHVVLAGPTYGIYASVSTPAGAFPQQQFQTLSTAAFAGGPGIDERHFTIAAGGGEFTAFWINDHDADNVNEAWYSHSAAGTFSQPHQASPDSAEDAERAYGDRNENGSMIEGWQIYIKESNSSIQVSPVAKGTPPVFGTAGSDDASGTGGDDLYFAQGGDDTYNAKAGNDTVYGEGGNDGLAGGSGSDLLLGGGQDDSLAGGEGGDTLKGGSGNDYLSGDAASFRATRMERYLLAGAPDILLGGRGRDELIGGAGFDTLNGGAGRDVCHVDSRKEKMKAKSCEVIRFRRAHS